LGQFLVARILIKPTKEPRFSKTKTEMRYSISLKPLELHIGSQKVKREKEKKDLHNKKKQDWEKPQNKTKKISKTFKKKKRKKKT